MRVKKIIFGRNTSLKVICSHGIFDTSLICCPELSSKVNGITFSYPSLIYRNNYKSSVCQTNPLVLYKHSDQPKIEVGKMKVGLFATPLMAHRGCSWNQSSTHLKYLNLIWWNAVFYLTGCKNRQKRMNPLTRSDGEGFSWKGTSVHESPVKSTEITEVPSFQTLYSPTCYSPGRWPCTWWIYTAPRSPSFCEHQYHSKMLRTRDRAPAGSPSGTPAGSAPASQPQPGNVRHRGPTL